MLKANIHRFSSLSYRVLVLKNQVDTFLLELMDKRFSSHSHLVSIAHYISNKVSGLIRPLHHIPVRFPVGNKHKTDSSSSCKKKWSGREGFVGTGVEKGDYPVPGALFASGQIHRPHVLDSKNILL